MGFASWYASSHPRAVSLASISVIVAATVWSLVALSGNEGEAVAVSSATDEQMSESATPTTTEDLDPTTTTAALSTPNTTIAPSPIPVGLLDDQVWDIRLITRPAIGDEPHLERPLGKFVYSLRFEEDAEFKQPSIRIRIGECVGLDILIEWLDPNTFRPMEVLPRQYDALFGCGNGVSSSWFFPGENHRVMFPEAGTVFFNSKPLTEETFVGGHFEVTYDESSNMLHLQRGDIIFSLTPSELSRFWIAAEELAQR